MTISDRQASYKSAVIRKSREMPNELAIGVAIRQAIRSKKVIDLLHGFGASVEYDRLLRLETQLAMTALERMERNDDVFIPANVVLGRHIFYAVDNIYFAEDIPSGKNSLHGTVMAVHQIHDQKDMLPELELSGQANMKSLKPIYIALGPRRAAALPGFHAMSGSDITGRFSGKGKQTKWKVFETAKDTIVDAFINIEATVMPSEACTRRIRLQTVCATIRNYKCR